MPAPNATGTQGSSRPAPASARIQALSLAAKDDHASKPAGAKPPACARPPSGQVPAIPCVRGLLPGSAIRPTPQEILESARLPEVVSSGIAEQNKNTRWREVR